jgi:hypothetical protein
MVDDIGFGVFVQPQKGGDKSRALGINENRGGKVQGLALLFRVALLGQFVAECLEIGSLAGGFADPIGELFGVVFELF